ncbi:hypothetical protein K505DRAFT_344577 [Melanomma pulvis-pyrius CBS 109.77]|uniref:Uncharacterized protein n=1 Tax=Melanomma pulvis-pyrius CBS 109.77 TaxID=1314802 RepID=A0A6A6WNJ6_9PLEO|nr:hypothetical protein K505DRAFT_344577 [Melanomma pulvis-pyrius CBS 109.77]
MGNKTLLTLPSYKAYANLDNLPSSSVEFLQLDNGEYIVQPGELFCRAFLFEGDKELCGKEEQLDAPEHVLIAMGTRSQDESTPVETQAQEHLPIRKRKRTTTILAVKNKAKVFVPSTPTLQAPVYRANNSKRGQVKGESKRAERMFNSKQLYRAKVL